MKRIGNDKELKPSFIGWIAHLHPENVKLDTRLDPEIAPHNPHKVIYDHLYKEHFKNIGKPWFGRGVMKKKTRKGRKKVSKKGISSFFEVIRKGRYYDYCLSTNHLYQK